MKKTYQRKKLFLCSSFADVAGLLNIFEKNLKGKIVTFIPTASKVEKINFYVKDAKKELEKANEEISFVITFESIKYLIKEEYGTISEIINTKKNEIKATEENLKRKAEEQAKREAEEKLRKEQEQQKEVEETKNETVPTAPETKVEDTEKVKKDTYICIKVNGLTEKTVEALQKVIKEHNLKYIKEMR